MIIAPYELLRWLEAHQQQEVCAISQGQTIVGTLHWFEDGCKVSKGFICADFYLSNIDRIDETTKTIYLP